MRLPLTSLAFAAFAAALLASGCKPRQEDGLAGGGASAVKGDGEPAGEATAAFWAGTLVFAEVQKVPAYFVRWNAENQTKVVASTDGGASYKPFWKTIHVTAINYSRSVKAGRGEEVLSPGLQPLGLIYNEAFHSWFAQYATGAEACKPLIAEMNAQRQFKVDAQVWELSIPSILEMAEEALSELIAGLVDAWSSELRAKGTRTIPTYATVRREFGLSLSPEHSLPGERWATPEKVRVAADKPISEALFKMALRLVESGCVGLAEVETRTP